MGSRIAVVSTFPPIHCGLATYTSDFINSLHSLKHDYEITPIHIIFNEEKPSNEIDSGIFIRFNHPNDYVEASFFLTEAKVQILYIQHEFKIFGGIDGEYILLLIKYFNKPIISTFHTVSENLTFSKGNILSNLAKISSLIYVFSKGSIKTLTEKYNINENKIHLIPHGVPIIEFKFPSESIFRTKYQVDYVFITTGLIRESKGIHSVLSSLVKLKNDSIKFKYFIVGENHPRNLTASSYRKSLIQSINLLNLNEEVEFIDQYLTENELINYIQSSDIGIIPYTRHDQSSSGVLSLIMACGRPIISTNFDFAQTVINNSSGILIDIDSDEYYIKIKYLISNKANFANMMLNNYNSCKSWRWNKLAEIFEKHQRSLLQSGIHKNSKYEKIL